MSVTIECVLDCKNHLGEGPVWDVDEGRLYWLDCTGPRFGLDAVWRMDPKSGKVESWALPKDIGAMALREQGGMVAAMCDGFYFMEIKGDKIALDLIQEVDADIERTRLNDGKVDRRGRFFAGGMDDLEELRNCGLWRLDADLSVTRVEDGLMCTNGPC
ncbi:MAG: SMP-30/gluconolactonase/LRE family protein, partial [Pseudomonadota bacterium]